MVKEKKTMKIEAEIHYKLKVFAAKKGMNLSDSINYLIMMAMENSKTNNLVDI